MPTTNQAMARFRASLLRRASAVAWVVLIIISAQAVRREVFGEPTFWVPMAALGGLLVISTATRWDRLMATRFAPWIAVGWLSSLIFGLTAFALVPQLTATSTPILYGIAAVSGLLLVWWAHAFMTVLVGAAVAFIAIRVSQLTAPADVLAQVLTVAVVSAATALVGLEFERGCAIGTERRAD